MNEARAMDAGVLGHHSTQRLDVTIQHEADYYPSTYIYCTIIMLHFSDVVIIIINRFKYTLFAILYFYSAYRVLLFINDKQNVIYIHMIQKQ